MFNTHFQTIKVQMQPELMTVVEKTTSYLKTYPSNVQQVNSNAGSGDANNGIRDHPLLNLIDLVYKQMKIIAESHALALKNYQSILKRYKLSDVEPYTVVDYWGQAQVVFQLMLADYLNIQSVNAEDQLKTSFPEQNINISSFFSRRKPQTLV